MFFYFHIDEKMLFMEVYGFFSSFLCEIYSLTSYQYILIFIELNYIEFFKAYLTYK